jgi:hypothetical protein
MLLRLGRGPTGPVTGRRPVEEVLLTATEPVPAAAASRHPAPL